MHSWLALYRATFSRDAMTVAERQAMIEVPLYRRNLDLVAEAPDRRLAAYCLCTISLEENTLTGRLVGYTDPHGTHPVYRHRGLPRALLLTGPWLLREQGVRTARLGTSSHNRGMQALARSLGLRVSSRSHYIVRSIQP